ncbi:hypothetical protein [Corynebacterium sp. SA-MJD20WY100]|uniref:hypothetical protein n=1 Tax=Corynebacterium sp. SA-MJD20WY100 TaxID=3142969 RepID=UPI00322142EB
MRLKKLIAVPVAAALLATPVANAAQPNTSSNAGIEVSGSSEGKDLSSQNVSFDVAIGFAVALGFVAIADIFFNAINTPQYHTLFRASS